MTTDATASPRSGWFDRSDRVRIEVSGPDRAKFLHNLVTNDIKRLAAGQGCEAFVTTPQGKTLAYVALTAGETSILLRSDVGQVETFFPHLQKYGVFDAIELTDVSANTFEVHVWGEAAERLRDAISLDPQPGPSLSNQPATWAGAPLRVIAEVPAGWPGLTLVGPAASRDAVVDAVAELAGHPATKPAEFEWARVAAGTPVSGRDVTPANLPQEVGRDRATISFTKGCYLGQETVARLDALGHVNKILRGLRIEGDAAPDAGAALISEDGKPAGAVTSAAVSPDSGEVAAMGYVRVAFAEVGTTVRVEIGGSPRLARVVELPAP